MWQLHGHERGRNRGHPERHRREREQWFLLIEGHNSIVGGTDPGEGNLVAITGTLNSTANRYVRVEFFANASADNTGNGQGQT